jgi:hypothetical protein
VLAPFVLYAQDMKKNNKSLKVNKETMKRLSATSLAQVGGGVTQLCQGSGYTGCYWNCQPDTTGCSNQPQ